MRNIALYSVNIGVVTTMTNSVNKYILKLGSSRNILSINNFTKNQSIEKFTSKGIKYII